MSGSLRTRIIISALAMFAGAGVLALMFTLFAQFAAFRALGILSMAGAAAGVGLQILLLRNTDPAALTELTARWREPLAHKSSGIASNLRSINYRAQQSQE